MDNTFKSPLTAISIGPGIRGIERGVSRVVRLREIAFVEREAVIIENLVAQMEKGILDPAVIWSDAKTFPAHLFRGKVNILFAGYPCQPFSSAGQRKGSRDERHLYPYIESTIDIIRPNACFFENVRGHVTLGLREVVESLERLGYRVHWGIFSAEETGASHKRERVFILAMADSCFSSAGNKSGTIGGGFGQQNVRQGNGKECTIWSGTASKLGNSNNKSLNSSIGGIRRELDSTGQELGDTADINKRDERPGEGQNEPVRGSGDVEIMGNTNNKGLQGWISRISAERSGERFTGQNGPFCPVSRPGQPQQAWEHPRVISRAVESTVGLSTHGYNFREDVLRALGNSVYEDTAELAFRTLLEKFIT